MDPNDTTITPTNEQPGGEPEGDTALMDGADTGAPAEPETSADEAALATIGEKLGETADEPGDAGGGEQPEALEPELIQAASFAGLSEQDLRDAIGAVGKDKAVKTIQGLIEKASARWGLSEQPKSQEPPATPAPGAPAKPTSPTPNTPAQTPAAPNQQPDPLDAFAADDFGKDFVADYPEGKPIVDAARTLAKQNKALQGEIGSLRTTMEALIGEAHSSLATDLYEFYSEVGKTFNEYGKVDGQPTPEQLALRQRVFAAARDHQRRSPVPIRFKDALRQAHAAVNVGKIVKPTAPTTPGAPTAPGKGAAPARRKGDVLPSSSGTPGSSPRSMGERDKAAMATLAKYGVG